MKQTSKRLVSIIIALLFVVATFIIFFNLIQPEYASILKLKAQAIGEQNLLANAKQAVQHVEELVNDYKSQGQNAANVTLAMPTDEDLAGALAQIYGLAQNSGITVESIGISAPSLQAQKASSTQIVKPVGAISFQIVAVGSYGNLKNFLSGLETNIRIFDLKSISVSSLQGTLAAGKNSVSAGPDSFTYNITVASYYQTR